MSKLHHCRGESIAFALTLLVVLTSHGAASAQLWTEAGDAGELPGTAQVTAGNGPLSQIMGSLSGPTDVDLYCVEVVDPGSFLAGLICATQDNPALWLFQTNGLGVIHNDTCAGGFKLIPPGYVVAGSYYLAVGQQGRQAQGGSGALWLSNLFTGGRVPDGPGATGAVTGWAGPDFGTVGGYQVNLTGAGFCDAAVAPQARTWGTIKVNYR